MPYSDPVSTSDPTPFATIPPDMLRTTTLAPSGSAFVGELKGQLIAILEGPELREKAIALIQKLIPGKILDRFAAAIYDVAVDAIKVAIREL